MSEIKQLTEQQILQVLQKGEIKEQGLLPYSSNHSFLVTVSDDDLTLPAVYKPQRGENPLWDFERGTLCMREVAAYEMSNGLGWQLVPPTVLRDGKYGLGSVQFYIDNDPDEHYFSVAADARFSSALRKMALFDYIINNADRKSGHCLVGKDECMWAIDHGIAFHNEYKLRTVIWEFSGQPIEDAYLADLCTVQADLANEKSDIAMQMCQLISREEYTALETRLQQLIQTTTYPSPQPFDRNFPWPPV
ncbi:MAG: SCO1664 family protein [Chloroflexota bacterium]